MIIRHSLTLLENLSELETSIKAIEEVLDELGIDGDREKLLMTLVNRKKEAARLAGRPFSQKKSN